MEPLFFLIGIPVSALMLYSIIRLVFRVGTEVVEAANDAINVPNKDELAEDHAAAVNIIEDDLRNKRLALEQIIGLRWDSLAIMDCERILGRNRVIQIYAKHGGHWDTRPFQWDSDCDPNAASKHINTALVKQIKLNLEKKGEDVGFGADNGERFSALGCFTPPLLTAKGNKKCAECRQVAPKNTLYYQWETNTYRHEECI